MVRIPRGDPQFRGHRVRPRRADGIGLLEHIGSKSCERRYAVLEVVDHPAADEYVIVSGFGEKSQWYRNVMANPRVRVSVGLRRDVPATATPMTREAAEETIDRYA